jgi:TM2 domain-containing membrane protein YozV
MASEWYYSHDGQRLGPVSSEQLKELALAGKLGPDDLVWKDGMEDWVAAGKIKKLLPATGAVVPAADPVPARSPGRDLNLDRPPDMAADISNRQMSIGLAAIVAGSVGVHKFILGQNTAGLIALLVTVLTCGAGAGVMAIIGMYEGVIYLRMSNEEFHQTYVVGRKAWF